MTKITEWKYRGSAKEMSDVLDELRRKKQLNEVVVYEQAVAAQ